MHQVKTRHSQASKNRGKNYSAMEAIKIKGGLP